MGTAGAAIWTTEPIFWPILERAEALGVPIYLAPHAQLLLAGGDRGFVWGIFAGHHEHALARRRKGCGLAHRKRRGAC